MKMHALSSGLIRMKKKTFYPDAAADEKVDFPVSCYLFRHPQGNVLFDSGCHPDAGEERWGQLTRAMAPQIAPGEDVISQLAVAGLGPGDIDVVVNSHLHCDHCGCNEFFTSATFFVHEDELETASDPAMEGLGYFRADWDHPMPLETVNREHDLFDDGRLVLMPLPGHSPGLIGLLAALDESGAFLIASDAVAVRENLDLEFIPKNAWNKDLSHKALAEVRRLEKSGATVICGHDAPQWASLKKGAEAYG